MPAEWAQKGTNRDSGPPTSHDPSKGGEPIPKTAYLQALPMGIVGAYSHPEIQGRLRQLADKLDRLAASNDPRRHSSRNDRTIRCGLVAKAIQQVLAEAPGPMRVCDIHAAVEDLLGQSVPTSSVKDWLAKNVKGERPRLVRLGQGRYRLMTEGRM
jgi:hypothetical protein